MATLIGISLRSGKKKPMTMMDTVRVTTSQGVGNDFRGKPGKRQVTVLSQKAWFAVCDELNVKLDWTVRRANLLVDDLDLPDSFGKMIIIGNVKLLITGETDPCSRMEAVHPGLFDALLKDWRGGVCCQVIEDGDISLNDKVVFVG